MAFENLFVCADVGGTFTDCLALWDDNRWGRQCGCIKVLSTGRIRCLVTAVCPDQSIEVDLPGELLGRFEGCKRDPNLDRLPDDFFRSARVECVVDGVIHRLGYIDRFDSARSRIRLESSDRSSATTEPIDELADVQRQPTIAPEVGSVLEIDCGIEAPVLATRLLTRISIDRPLPAMKARLGTTRGTNALLTRTGAPTVLVVNKGFGDVLEIGEQDRSELFDLSVQKTPPLAQCVIEIEGRLDAEGNELCGLNPAAIEDGLRVAKEAGFETASICLLHAYLRDDHEKIVQQIAERIGFRDVSRSSEVAPLIKFIARAETTTLDAYLNPILADYIRRVRSDFGASTCQIELMTSGGNLVDASRFRGRDSVLSGPAGGVVGLEQVAKQHACELAIGLDMGGTSTDVSRFHGRVSRRYETRVADLRVMTPMMDIHTVAAGGGSICDFVGGRLVVGPSSAGANPGPACYGRGGPLTVTDVNLLLGRLRADRFPFPLSVEAAEERLEHVADKMRAEKDEAVEPLVLAEGFLNIAVTHMAEAVRAITTARGVDVRDHALVGFGGAAAQHLCRIADALGIRKILDHPLASVLSAAGIGVASVGKIQTQAVYQTLDQITVGELNRQVNAAKGLALDDLGETDENTVQTILECDCRYEGTDSTLAIKLAEPIADSFDSVADAFHQKHRNHFGYRRDDRPIELVSVRVEARASQTLTLNQLARVAKRVSEPGEDQESIRVFQNGSWQAYRLIERDRLVPGDPVAANSLIVADQSTLIVEPGWHGSVQSDGAIVLERQVSEQTTERKDNQGSADSTEPGPHDAVQMEIVARRLQSIADSMGEVLRRTATSVNVKERMDFSCAVFRGDGTLVANAPHVPVHLGAMGHTVRHLAGAFHPMHDGDCYVSNDPYAGGSHLPDVTVVTPVFFDSQTSKPSFFVASRAHHAEIGGKTPGSMPPLSNHLAEEGVLIRAFALVREGVSYEDAMGELLSGGRYPSRNVAENLADLRAQVAAAREGHRGLVQMVREFGFPTIERMMAALMEVASESVSRWIESLPESVMRFRDQLDDGTVIQVKLQRSGNRLDIDFDGTAGVHVNGFNATKSIVHSAVLYVTRCFCDSNLPLCDGAMRPITLNIPPGLLSPPANDDPAKCAAVVAGNVETSQRLVDVLLGAIGSELDDAPVFRSVAASQGTMNNVLFGNDSFGYYETIGGGSGATVFGPGADGIHTHMTNTRITDAEVLESRLPVRLREFSVRRGSGGKGRHRGGDGLVREFEFLEPLTVSLITNRRTKAPYGAFGGKAGTPGRNLHIHSDGKSTQLPSSTTLTVQVSERLRIETPGGGGWGQLE